MTNSPKRVIRAKSAPAKAKKTASSPAPMPPATSTEASVTKAPTGKVGTLVALLRRPQGAQLQDMMTATGWQAHSVRGAIAGAIKKKLGLPVTSEKTDAGRSYRIVEGGA